MPLLCIPVMLLWLTRLPATIVLNRMQVLFYAYQRLRRYRWHLYSTCPIGNMLSNDVFQADQSPGTHVSMVQHRNPANDKFRI